MQQLQAGRAQCLRQKPFRAPRAASSRVVRAAAVATKSVSGTMAELKAQKKWVHPALGPGRCPRQLAADAIVAPAARRSVGGSAAAGPLLVIALKVSAPRDAAPAPQLALKGTRPGQSATCCRVAFIPFLCAGDPDLATTAKAVIKLDQIGANVIELGVPYSVRPRPSPPGRRWPPALSRLGRAPAPAAAHARPRPSPFSPPAARRRTLWPTAPPSTAPPRARWTRAPPSTR
jgi:hypothetical protein